MNNNNVKDICTLSVKVTEEITNKNLHQFLKTSIKNSDFFFSKNSFYSFYYNSATFTYEILFFEKPNDTMFIEPFYVVSKYCSLDDAIKVFLTNRYFIITQNNKLLIYKKVENINKEELTLYIEQIYKIQDFIIESIEEKDIENKKNLNEIQVSNIFYELYPNNVFNIFIFFVLSISFLLICLVYLSYHYKETKPIVKEPLQSIKNNDYLSITNIVTLFDDLKSSGIVINKLKYSKSILQTILKHREKAHLLSFVNRYKKTIHIKSLQFDANKNMYFMEVSIVYKN